MKAIVVLTDGQENHGPHTRRYIADVADMINGLNGHVFAIGLGHPEVLNPGALEALCNGNNGYMAMTGDLTPDAYCRLTKYYQQILAGATNNEVVLDPEGWIMPGQKHRIPFWLNEADLTAKGILLTLAPYAIRYVLETPDGDIIDPGVAGPHPMASFEMGRQVSLSHRSADPARRERRARGPLARDPDSRRKELQALPGVARQLPGVVRLGRSARHSLQLPRTAYSSLRMKESLAQTRHEPGATMTVRAVLTEYGIPVASRANCRAELMRSDNTGSTLAMPEVEPGVFQATTLAAMAGIYRFRILAEGRTLRGRLFTREQTLTGAVWKGGDNPPPSSKDDPNGRDDRFCRLIHCLLHRKGIQEALRKAGISPDELQQCLEEYCRKPSPGQPPYITQPKLGDRLRSIIRDDRVLQAVMREVEREKE